MQLPIVQLLQELLTDAGELKALKEEINGDYSRTDLSTWDDRLQQSGQAIEQINEALAFINEISRLDTTEDLDNRGACMENDDAVNTVDRLISESRDLVDSLLAAGEKHSQTETPSSMSTHASLYEALRHLAIAETGDLDQEAEYLHGFMTKAIEQIPKGRLGMLAKACLDYVGDETASHEIIERSQENAWALETLKELAVQAHPDAGSNKQTSDQEIHLTGKVGVTDILSAARHHGLEGDPEHEVGDLQDVIHEAWELMSDDQRSSLLTTQPVNELLGRSS